MKCTNKDCPCGFYSENSGNNCRVLFDFKLCKCPSFKPEEKTKRTITVSELIKKGARFIHTKDAIIPIGFSLLYERVYFGESWSYISALKSDEHKWSTDAIHLQLFEVEE